MEVVFSLASDTGKTSFGSARTGEEFQAFLWPFHVPLWEEYPLVQRIPQLPKADRPFDLFVSCLGPFLVMAPKLHVCHLPPRLCAFAFLPRSLGNGELVAC